MASLIKLKTWQYAWNLSNAVSTVEGTDCSDVLLLIKNALKGFGSNPWQVVGSSDGTTAALDGVDRLTDTSKCVKASSGTAHSWIVLKQPGISSNFQLLFNFNHPQTNFLTIAVSPGAGFTGGTTLTAPTATDQDSIWSQSYWLGAGGSRQYRAHVMQSTDGQCTRIFVHTNSVCVLWILLDRAWDPVPSWTNPCVYQLRCNGLGGQITSMSLLNQDAVCSATPQFRAIAPSGAFMSLLGTAEGMAGNAATTMVPLIFGYPNELEKAAGRTVYPFVRVGLTHNATAGMKGRHGEVADLWFGSRLFNNGDMVPAIGPSEFIAFRDMIVPNDGTRVLVA